MKRRIGISLCLVLTLAMTGCGNNSPADKPGSNPPTDVNDVEDIQTIESSTAPDTTVGESTSDIDVDLTILSSTMVYSEVYNMMSSPEKYIGKTVKMKGWFTYYHDETTDNDYFSCIIQDASACCAQGIEFVLADDYIYPDDYPEVSDEICVVGVFDTYEERGCTYYTLRNASLL